MCMTFDELDAELGLYRYREGWMLTLWWDEEHANAFLYVVATVPNAMRDKGSDTQLRIAAWVPPMRTPSDFKRWLFWRLREIEIHECMEWFQLRTTGKPVYDPHGPIDPPMDLVIKRWNQYQADGMDLKHPLSLLEEDNPF